MSSEGRQPHAFIVARYAIRKNALPDVTYLQRDKKSFGEKATAFRFLSTTEAGRAMEGLDVGADALATVGVSK